MARIDDHPPEPEPARPGRGATRRLAAMLGVAIALLVGTTLYLLARDRSTLWAGARQDTQETSAALEASISALLAQSTASLRGIRSDLREPPRGEADRDAVALAVVRDAMRFDPLSAWLGVRRAGGRGVLAVDHAGAAAPAGVAQAMERAFAAATASTATPAGGAAPGVLGDAGSAVHLGALFRLPGDETWYLPVTLEAPGAEDGASTLFALVPRRALVQAARQPNPRPESFVSMITPDGRRLIRAVHGGDSVEFNGPPIRPETLRVIQRVNAGTFETYSSITGKASVFGFTHSPSLPLVIVAAVPVETLDAQWVRQSIAPTVLLVLGIGVIAVFGVRLRASLRAQWAWLRRQEYLASHDSLTGLRNRDAFLRLLEHEVATRPGDPFAIVLMDLNNFKDINDTLGHAAGDQVLRELGARLDAFLAPRSATVARLGGDEMVVFVRALADDAALAAFGADMLACLARSIRIAGVEIEAVASMGAATFPRDAATPSELMRCADIAMYAARAELSPFARYAERMDSFTPGKLALKAAFARALRERTLHLVYQPKVALADGALRCRGRSSRCASSRSPRTPS